MNGRKPRARPLRRYPALLVALALLVAACGDDAGQPSTTPTTPTAPGTPSAPSAPSTPEAPREPRVFRLGWPTDATTLDLSKSAGGATDHPHLVNVYESLTQREHDGSASPALAERWEFNDDFTEITWYLRRGVKFHNGEEMTADDVVYSIERALDPDFVQYGAQAGIRLTAIDQMQIIDDYTIHVTLHQADPNLMHNAPDQSPIIPRSEGERWGYEDFGTSPESAVGAGPYKVVEWNRDQSLILEVHEDFWAGRPYFDRVEVRIIPDATARAAALIAGDVDAVGHFALEQIDLLDAHDHVEILPVAGAGRQRLTLNTTVAPLNIKEVRMAIAHALDMETILGTVYRGLPTIIPAFTIPEDWGYNPDLVPYHYDPDYARELLAQAGFPNGLDRPLTFYTRQQEAVAEEMIQAMAGYLAEVGIPTTIQVLSNADYAEANLNVDMDMGFAAMSGGSTFHAWLGLDSLFGTCENGGGQWGGFYCNEELQRIIREAPAVEAQDPDAAFAMYQEAQRIIHEDYALGGSWQVPWLYAKRVDLEWNIRPNNRYHAMDAYFPE